MPDPTDDLVHSVHDTWVLIVCCNLLALRESR
jgi:hypothetical protein